MGKNTIIAAMSNLSTAYNLVVINIVQILVQNQYCGGDHCHDAVSIASTSCLVGAIVGQLSFGYVGDCLGRSRSLQLTMALSIFGAFISALAVPLQPDDPSSIFYFLALARFFLGVGVGGVYPLSATIASESAGSAAKRGRTASIVFSMQGVGNLIVPIIALLLVAIFGNPKDLEHGGPSDPGLSWRFALGLGALPGVLLVPFKASETRAPRRRSKILDVDLEIELPVPVSLSGEIGTAGTNGNDAPSSNAPETGGSEAPAQPPPLPRLPPSPQVDLFQALRMRSYWGKLLGCAGGWLLFDVTFYGNQLFQARVLQQIFAASATSDPHPVAGDIHQNPALQMLVIAAIGLPGYYVAVCFMDSFGRRNIQLQGFFFMAVTFGILGTCLIPLQTVPALMLLLYGLTFFFSNFGPNATTFILPSETFPAHLRSTLNGFCAASGKLGATIGSAAFVPLKQAIGLGGTLLACAVVSLLGLLLTVFFVEDRRGKDMEGESELLGDPGGGGGGGGGGADTDATQAAHGGGGRSRIVPAGFRRTQHA